MTKGKRRKKKTPEDKAAAKEKRKKAGRKFAREMLAEHLGRKPEEEEES